VSGEGAGALQITAEVVARSLIAGGFQLPEGLSLLGSWFFPRPFLLACGRAPLGPRGAVMASVTASVSEHQTTTYLVRLGVSQAF
jgi:hypothetical protein